MICFEKGLEKPFIFFKKAVIIKKYKKVIDIHTDGSVKFFKGQPIISFGGNIIKRSVEDSIFYNFKCYICNNKSHNPS